MRMSGSARLVLGFGLCALGGFFYGCTPAEDPAADSGLETPVATAQPSAPARQGTVTQNQAATAALPKTPAPPAAPVSRPVIAQSPIAPAGQSPIAPGGRTIKVAVPDFDANLAKNGSFEMLRDDGTPRGWAVAPNGIATVTSESAPHGENAITIESTEESYGILAYRVPVAAADLGKHMQVSAAGMSDSHWNMTMALEAVQGGEKTQLARTGWGEAPGTWARVKLDTELPSDIDPASLEVRIVVKNEAGHTFQLDDLRASVAVLTNGSFELTADEGRPGGWAVAPIEMIRPSDSVDAYDGDRVLGVESSDEGWIVVARKLAISAGDLGRKLTVAARAKTPMDRGMFLSVQCNVNGEVTELGNQPWPESAERWTQVQTTIDLPQDADPDSVQARIKIRNEGGLRYYIDDVQAQLH